MFLLALLVAHPLRSPHFRRLSVSGYLGYGLRRSGPPGIIGFYPYSWSSLIPP